ncbi:hypothetical protein EDD11_005626 [Mortierella claussenii]|nr:hypothetical protein EDD11_005626 [Mortierella claussenii]
MPSTISSMLVSVPDYDMFKEKTKDSGIPVIAVYAVLILALLDHCGSVAQAFRDNGVQLEINITEHVHYMNRSRNNTQAAMI